jgi:hypothetical protein
MIGGMETSEWPRLELLEVDSLVSRFETQSVPLEDFHHRQHLIVAARLAAAAPFDAALDRMRRGLQALLAKHGKDGYHETVTAFWMHVLAHRLARCPAEWPLEVRLGDAVGWAESARPLAAHYSAERLADADARRVFLDPDRQPLPPL